MSLNIPTITFYSALICVFFIYGGEILSIGERNSHQIHANEKSEGSWLVLMQVFFIFMFTIVIILGGVYSCLTSKRCTYVP